MTGVTPGVAIPTNREEYRPTSYTIPVRKVDLLKSRDIRHSRQCRQRRRANQLQGGIGLHPRRRHGGLDERIRGETDLVNTDRDADDDIDTEMGGNYKRVLSDVLEDPIEARTGTPEAQLIEKIKFKIRARNWIIFATHSDSDDGFIDGSQTNGKGVLCGVLEDSMEARTKASETEPIGKSNFKMCAQNQMVFGTHRDADDALDAERLGNGEGVLCGVLEDPMEARMKASGAELIKKSEFNMRPQNSMTFATRGQIQHQSSKGL
ncbi:hypothetical protein C8F04DRAFT_1196483 [Mycena alexandri]|uniref:Uncharacterized protein n=1 Tax=Mycena alexandri TaxID=1745969 RepID=A0AAD6WPM0_9AGAR|nr:hypothetical protein C8F04DRAFT_1196483 [Mycena alexandri]